MIEEKEYHKHREEWQKQDSKYHKRHQLYIDPKLCKNEQIPSNCNQIVSEFKIEIINNEIDNLIDINENEIENEGIESDTIDNENILQSVLSIESKPPSIISKRRNVRRNCRKKRKHSDNINIDITPQRKRQRLQKYAFYILQNFL